MSISIIITPHQILLKMNKQKQNKCDVWFARKKRKAECRILVGKPEGKKPLGRPRRRCETNRMGGRVLDLSASEQGQVLG